MAANLCGCTAPRCMTPTEPIIKRKLKPGSRQISSIPESGAAGTDSRYTSTRSEDLREIQQLFDQSQNKAGTDSPPTTGAPDEKSYDSSTVSSKHSKIASFFRRRLSRTFSKSKLDTPDPEKLKEAKQEIRSNLLNDKSPDHGGYDADAAVLGDVEEPLASPEVVDDQVPRGRTKGRSHSIHFSTWSGPSGPARLSIDLSPPRLSFGDHGYHRRSQSMYSVPSRAASPDFYSMRLPSFTGERETSHTWKKGVMESLQINSPSTSHLVHMPVRRPTTREKRNFESIQWPLREHVLTPDSEAPLIPTSPRLNHSISEGGSLLLASARPSEDLGSLTRPGHSFDRGVSSPHYESQSSSNAARPHFFGRPERRPNRSNASVHLYSMGISRHLRSTSSFTSAGVRSKVATRAPTAAPTRSHTPVAKEKEPMKTHLAVEDLPPLPPSATKTTRASSEYSFPATSTHSSPNAKQTTFDENTSTSVGKSRLSGTPKKMTTATATNTGRSSLHTPKTTLPENNPSLSNLSDLSENSGKISRFKEEFDSKDQKSKKRTSIANMFSFAANTIQTRRRKNESVDSFDGVVDEPKRLQRAMALTEQTDAAGLLAKAIRDKQVEKSALYLKGNKDLAQREVFRQRSSSFCRPRGDSLAAEEAAAAAAGRRGSEMRQRGDWHRRSTSETLLRPDASLPTLQPPPLAPGAVPRAHSTGHLTPEFTTPVFSGSSFLTPNGRQSPGRSMSISIDPTATGPGEIARRPSFQLNDMPAVVETPETENVPEMTANKSFSVPRPMTMDSDDSNLDLGAWSRYPSHTREQRTGSAGTRDDVKTRDFAYDINPLNVTVESSDNEVASGKKKRGKKKKKRAGTLPKSRSIMFEGLRNYARIFTRTSSAEFLHYGKGHRSSISAGGALEHPELEILPPIFAPLPVIPDRARQDEDDPVLAPTKQDIELKQLKHRRKDHGHSFAEPSRPGASRVDGCAEETKARPEEARRVASSPALVGTLIAPDGSLVRSALTYARHYESCVYLPPSTSHSNSSRPFGLVSSDSSYARITNASTLHSPVPSSPAGSALVDKMLASQPTSANVSPLPSPLTSPVLTPMQSLDETVNEVMLNPNAHPKKRIERSAHCHSQSVGSVASLRASSMDLLKTLKEAEERERRRALEDLLSRARNSMSEKRRKRSAEYVRAKGEASGSDEGHRTWPGAYRGERSVVEAN